MWWGVAYQMRLVRVLFLEPIRIQDLRQLRVIWSDRNASLAHTTFNLTISTTVNPYCFISVAVSLNSTWRDLRRDLQHRFKFNFKTCKTWNYCCYKDVEEGTHIFLVFTWRQKKTKIKLKLKILSFYLYRVKVIFKRIFTGLSSAR